MNRNAEDIQKLFVRARADSEYAALTDHYRKMFEAFEKLTNDMTADGQNTAWGFVCISEQMNWRMLELICDWYDLDITE